jgi:hypothetical protein
MSNKLSIEDIKNASEIIKSLLSNSSSNSNVEEKDIFGNLFPDVTVDNMIGFFEENNLLK